MFSKNGGMLKVLGKYFNMEIVDILGVNVCLLRFWKLDFYVDSVYRKIKFLGNLFFD